MRGIDRRGGPGGAGLASETNNDGATATISASHANFANYWTAASQTNYVGGGGNQGTSPSFVSATTGDYRQAPGSVTVGAGLDALATARWITQEEPRPLGSRNVR